MKNISEAMNFNDAEIKKWDTVVSHTLITKKSARQISQKTLNVKIKLFFILKGAIYKTRNTGTGNGMRGMFTRIPGNLLGDSGEFYYFNIPGNVSKDSRECSRTFRGMFEKIPGNAAEDCGECSRRFRGMFKKIPGKVRKNSGEC